MKRYSFLMILFLAAMMIATSCKKDDDNNPEPAPEPTPAEEEKDFRAVPLSITVSIAPMNGSIDGIEPKQTFAKGDVIEITNPDVLYEPLTISADGSAGKSSAEFTAELKVKKGAELVSGTTKLSAVLKNGSNYNNGKPLADVKAVDKPYDGLDQYCCWSCEGFTYRSDANTVSLAPSTVFVEFNLFRDEVKMTINNAEFCETISGSHLFAVPSGTKIEISNAKFEMILDGKDKSIYHLTASAPDECIPHLFSIGEDKRVFFSKGNLQYRPLDGAWRLAPQQYHRCFNHCDMVGENFADWMGEDKWTDLLNPWSWIEGGNPGSTIDDFALPVDQNGEMDGQCVIGAQWIVLSSDEWEYLTEKRPDAAQKRAGVVVDGIEGFMILPDEWTAPDGFSFVKDFRVGDLNEIPNQYTVDEWAAIEATGAVFLPDTGILIMDIAFVGVCPSYQARNRYKEDGFICCFAFYPYTDDCNVSGGISAPCAVRLVQLQSGNTMVNVE